MIQSIAFLTYAVSDIKAARKFYEGILGLKVTHEAGDEWFEYDVGDTTFAISASDAEHPVPVRARQAPAGPRRALTPEWGEVKGGDHFGVKRCCAVKPRRIQAIIQPNE